jgi:hypothetical protein
MGSPGIRPAGVAAVGAAAGQPYATAFQAGADPALVANLAGARERQVASPGERLYTLVHWGREQLRLRIGAAGGTGRVLKIQPKPTTADDLPLALREAYAGLYHPSAEFFNSSVAQFAETSWRWQAARRVASELRQDAPDYTRPPVSPHSALPQETVWRCPNPDPCGTAMARRPPAPGPRRSPRSPHRLWILGIRRLRHPQ